MNTRQPTEQEIEKFWKWCGFTERGGFPVWPDGKTWPQRDVKLPAINLNNLFKYAVPRLPTGSLLWYGGNKGYGVCINNPHVESDNQDPALALFWAIYEVIQEVKP
jgi:hypothetical protein